MVQIALSVRILSKQNTVAEMKRILTIVDVSVVIIVIIIVTVSTAILLPNNFSQDLMELLYCSIYLLLSILFLFTMTFMIRTLDSLASKLGCDPQAMSEEKTNI